MLQATRLARNNLRAKQGEPHGDVGIGVRHLHEFLAHVYDDVQFFPAFAHERLLRRFCRLHLAPANSHKRPRALPAGRWQMRNASPRQISAATTSTICIPSLRAHIARAASFAACIVAKSRRGVKLVDARLKAKNPPPCRIWQGGAQNFVYALTFLRFTKRGRPSSILRSVWPWMRGSA